MKLKFTQILTLELHIGSLRCLERPGLQDSSLIGLGMIFGINCWHIGILQPITINVLQPKGTELPPRVGAYTQAVPLLMSMPFVW